MADDIRLVIGVEQSGLLKAITNTESLEKKVKKLSDAYARDAVSYGRYNKAIGDLATATKKSKKELLEYGKALRANEKATKQAALATKQAELATKQFAQARKDAIAEDQRRTAETKKGTLELDRMRKSVDKAYAADQKFTKYKRLLRAEVDKGNLSIKEAARLQLQYRKSVQASNVAVMAQTKASNRMGVVTQQAGYQVSDFIVQVQSGQSAFVAFGQQASQLVGILPLMSGALGVSAGALIAISAGLGIVIPLLTALGLALTATKRSADKAKDSILTLADAQGELAKSTSSYQTKIKMLEFGVDTAAEAKALEELVSLRKKLSAEQSKQGVNAITISERSKDLQGDLVSDLEKQITKTEELVEANAKVRAEYEAQAALQKSASQLVERNKQAELDRIKAIVAAFKDAEEVRQKARDDQKAADASAEESIRLGQQKLSLMMEEKDVGKDTGEYARLAASYERENLYLKLEQEGVSKDIIDRSVELLKAQQEVTAEMIASADAAERLKNNLEIASSFRVGGDLGEFANVAGGLDAFGGAGSFKYGGSQTFKPGTDKKAQKSDLQILKEQLRLERALVGQTEARQRVIQALGVKFVEDNPKTVAGLEAQITANENLLRIEEERKRMNDLVTDSMENGLMAMADGTKTVSAAFRDMAREIIAELYRILVVQQMVNAAKSFFGFPFADGGAFSGGSQIQAYANGGVVGSPTLFPMAGGKTGLMGEAGPEAILPLKRGANGKLGVQMEGGGGDNVVINQSFNFQANGDDSVKKIIAQAAPQIAQMTKNSMLNDRRRGGTTKAVFG